MVGLLGESLSWKVNSRLYCKLLIARVFSGCHRWFQRNVIAAQCFAYQSGVISNKRGQTVGVTNDDWVWVCVGGRRVMRGMCGISDKCDMCGACCGCGVWCV